MNKPIHKVIYKYEGDDYIGMFQLCNQKRSIELGGKENMTLYHRCVTCKNCLRKLAKKEENE